MIKQNLHTHTNCDHGKDSVEEMVQAAIKQNFTRLGFSGHGFNRPLSSTSMTLESSKTYRDEVARCREKYKDQIEIFYGVEQDSMNRIDTDEFDYVIGSVHYVVPKGTPIAVDDSTEDFARLLAEGYDGDIRKMVEDYYSDVEEMMDWPEVDIIGHIDLISKFNEDERFFAFDAPWYLAAAQKAIDKGIEKGKVFEMNTGAIARGNRQTPYPHTLLLEYMAKKDAKLCINTDCHDRTYLDLGIEDCLERAKKAGFTQLYAISDKGLVPEDISLFYGSRRPAIRPLSKKGQPKATRHLCA